MKKRVAILFLIIVLIISFLYIVYKPYNHFKFKKEYESLNGKKTEDKLEYRKIKIDNNNPFIYSSDKKIVKMINNKETFIVYFGANWCPWCRSVLPTMIETAKKNNIDTIYYVDISNIRNEYKAVGNIPELTKEGSKNYYELLKKLDNVLEDYTLTGLNGETIDIGEKRIYAPSLIKIEKGKATKITTGISKMQDNPYMKINKEIKKDMQAKFNKILK